MSFEAMNENKILKNNKLPTSILDNMKREKPSMPNIESFCKIAELLDLSIDYILTGKNIELKQEEPISNSNPIILDGDTGTLRNNETDIILKFRHLDERDQEDMEVIHAVAMSDVSGDEILVATENTGGDGAVVSVENGENMAVLVEQTLATYKEDGDLLEVIRRRVGAKSSKGENYAENKHLVVLCNNNGDLIEKELAKIVSLGMFDIVNIIGFQDNEQGRHFLSYIFDKDVSDKAIHRMAIDNKKLWQAAIDIFEEEQKAKNF